MITRRHLISIGLSSLALPIAARASDGASTFPNRVIRILHATPPGGSTDGPLRVLAEAASRVLKQPIIVENRPGAGGTLPARALQSASPDGYTLGVILGGVYRLPYTSDIKWNPATDLSYIIGLTGFTFGIAVRPDSPFHSMADLIAAAKLRPGVISYGTPGITTANHLTMEHIAQLTGIKLNHIPFKGTAETLQALMGGQIDLAAETSAWAGAVKAGKLRLISVWGPKRLANFPQVPTLREQGIDVVQTSLWGLAAPKGTDPIIVTRLHDAFKQAMETPEFRQVLAQYETEPIYLSSRDFQQYAVDTMKTEKSMLDLLGLSNK